MQLWFFRCLVGCINSSKSLNLTGTGFLIQSLGITLLANLDRGVDKHLDKITRLFIATSIDRLTDKIAIFSVGADKCGQRQRS